MSDFDKEAEREKLREKYERDKADREATQHMSDLLLKGATMTNTHCGVCGDPLFQQDDTTFCPSCHGSPGAVDGQGGVPQQGGRNAGTGTAATPGDSGAAGDAGDSHTDATTETSSRTSAASDSPSPATDQSATDRATADSSGTQIDVSSPASDSHRSESESDPTPPATGHTRAESRTGTNTETNATRPTSNRSSGDLADTRGALRETLEYFSQEAARTDDPRYAKECLEAAREAAKTLSTLR